MIQINMVAPKGDWLRLESWRGIYTIFWRQKGQSWRTCCQIHLWGLPDTTNSFYTAKKVQRIVHYAQN